MRKGKGLLALGAVLVLAGLLASCSTNTPTTGTTAEVQLYGVVASDGTLAGRTLVLDQATITKNGDPADVTALKPGMVVAATGVEVGTEVRVQSADIKVEIYGPVEAVNLDDSELVVLKNRVKVTPLTNLYEDDGTTIALADIKVGDFVEVSGVREADGTIIATYVERKTASPESYNIEVKGFACNLDDTAAKTFELWSGSDCTDTGFATGLTVDYSNATVEGTPAEGVKVEVKGTLEGSLITASKVEFYSESTSSPSPYAKVELYGPVTNLDTAAKTFELMGYLVDYASAYKVEGTLAEGAFVEVEGVPDANDPTLIRAYEVEVKYSHYPDYSPSYEVKGLIEAIDYDNLTLTVSGISFYADANTVIKQDDPDMPITFAELKEGDYVEVKYSDVQNDAGAYYAVKIERYYGTSGGDDSYSGDYREAKGTIEAIDYANLTLTVSGMSFFADANTVIKLDDPDVYITFADLKEGDYVEVYYNPNVTNDTGAYYAVKIEKKNSSGDDSYSGYREAKGTIEAIDYVNLTLNVAGISFFADANTVIKQDDPDVYITFADLKEGDYVEIYYDPNTTNDAGAYYAVKIEKKNSSSDYSSGYKMELEGYVQNPDPANQTFEVGGMLVKVDANTKFECEDYYYPSSDYCSPDTFWNIVLNNEMVWVEVEGYVQSDDSGTYLLAYEVEVKLGYDD